MAWANISPPWKTTGLCSEMRAHQAAEGGGIGHASEQGKVFPARQSVTMDSPLLFNGCHRSDAVKAPKHIKASPHGYNSVVAFLSFMLH